MFRLTNRPVPRRLALLTCLLLAAACERGPEPAAERPATATAAAGGTQYLREYIFLGTHEGAPLVVPFSFRTVEREEGLERTIRAWLARGPTWDPFLEESWMSDRASGVWRVLPRGDLQIAVDGTTEVAALWYQRAERSLRLELGRPLSAWNQGIGARYRLLDGRLVLGAEPIPGILLELLLARGEGAAGRDVDWLFLTGGDSLHLVLAEQLGRGEADARSFGWSLDAGNERAWSRVQVRWLEMRPYEEARRDIPLRWSFRIPESGVTGEVQALGYDVRVGPDRGGRRAVEARYTVEGWVERDSSRIPVRGIVRHVQE